MSDPSERNTGLPASAPYSKGEWGPPSGPGQWEPAPPPSGSTAETSPWGKSGEHYGRPAFAPPDPAAVGGPPWPALVAVGHYVPPRMIRWPVVAGFLLVAVCIGIILSISGSSTISKRVWVADHFQTLNTIKKDQLALNADNPAQGGSATKWLTDWQNLHDDTAAAATLPNPGGSATAPWRELINDFFNGSTELLQAVRTHNQELLTRAERTISAAYAADDQFNRAIGFTTG
jgi:hypothetical protein